MSEEFVRHFISFLAMVVAVILWYAGYLSGINGWWFTVFGAVFVYAIVFWLLEV